MKNPYKVLGLKQDASNSDIVKSQIKALKSKKYTMKEITEAQATLRKPSDWPQTLLSRFWMKRK